MNTAHDILVSNDVREIIIFTVGDLLCGLDISHAQEINRNLSITPVPQSPDYVRGVLNLRGQVITVVDLRVKLELDSVDISPGMRIIVVRTGTDGVGLLVDSVDDIVPVRERDLTPPPSNIGGVRGEFFSAVYKMDSDLAAIVDIEHVLERDELNAAGRNDV
ncbi:MAG: purine-binding chemotaxis protein CheW [Candidatus Latescibacteria bacterium]|jgi:purine-binding chemotaxis protein CheW|nr:purine-binding chemotaxis protein CheW [Candidatus Latescibacterota bacterium]